MYTFLAWNLYWPWSVGHLTRRVFLVYVVSTCISMMGLPLSSLMYQFHIFYVELWKCFAIVVIKIKTVITGMLDRKK